MSNQRFTSVWDAIEVLGGSLFPDRFCEFHPGRHPLCVRGSDCSIRSIWRLADDAVRSVLSRISLRDLHRAERREASEAPGPLRQERVLHVALRQRLEQGRAVARPSWPK